MLTIKKRGRCMLALVAAACLSLTACGPPGTRALHKGDELIRETNYDAAIGELSHALSLLTNDPADIRARAAACNLLGLAYHGTGNPAKALQYYQQALVLNRNLTAADFNIACLEFEQTNLASAKDFFTTYTTLQKWNVDGFLKLGEVSLRLASLPSSAAEKSRQLDSAKKSFETAQGLTRTAEAANNLGVIELLSAPRPTPVAVSNALTRFNVALAVDPQYAAALLNSAIVYDKYLNDERKALETYGKYLALEPAPRYAKEVMALTNGLDKALRFQVGTAGHAGTSISNEPAPGAISVTPSKGTRPPVTNTVDAGAPHPPAENAPAAVSPSNSLPPPASTVITPPAAPSREPPPTTPPAEATQTAPVPARVAPTVPTSAPIPQPTPSSAPPPPKKSVLSEINPINWFRKNSSSTPSSTKSNKANSGPVVTPLPDFDSHSSAHYNPAEVSVDPGNRQEAVRLRAEGIISEKASRLQEAEDSYQAAVKADPSYFDACLSLGLVGIRSEDYSTALEALHHAVVLDPESADARYAYAWALEKKAYYLDAANELEKLLSQKPDEIRAHLLLGNLYAQQLAQPDLARGHYEQVLNTDPKNPQAPAIRVWLQSFPAH
jgi:tetratricopeptide (TPR) repeat protein